MFNLAKKLLKKISLPIVTTTVLIAASLGIAPNANAANKYLVRSNANPNLCVSVRGQRASEGAQVELTDCNANDPTQQVEFNPGAGTSIKIDGYCVGHTNGLYQPKIADKVVVRKNCDTTNDWKNLDRSTFSTFRFTNMVMDVADARYVSGTPIQMHQRSAGNKAQSFYSEPIGGNSYNAPSQTQTGKTVISSAFEYEYWIVASYADFLNSIPEVRGHVFNAIIRREIVKYSDGSQSSNGWKSYKTFGFYGNDEGKGLLIDYSKELNIVQSILNSEVNGQYEVRKSNISERRANWIINNQQLAGCDPKDYSKRGLGVRCNCVTFATRAWYEFTSHQEDFRAVGYFSKTPHDTVELMRGKTEAKGSQFVDNGKKWE